MALPVAIPVVGALLGGLLLLAGGKSSGKRLSDTQAVEALTKLKGFYVGGQPVSHTPRGVYLYQWQREVVSGSVPVSATSWAIDMVRKGWVVWSDITLLSPSRVILALAPPGIVPTGEWAILIDQSSIGRVEPHLGSYHTPGGYVPKAESPAGTVPAPVPGDTVPVKSPADVPNTPPPVAVPAATGTGIPEVDEKMASPDATPYQLRQIAAELKKTGRVAESERVSRRANELYAELRAKHAVLGGTPFVVRDHHGHGVSGHLPNGVASHYGGSLDQLGKANPGKRRWSDWKIGATWLLPLEWDVEAKAPPPIVAFPAKKPAAKSATKARKGKLSAAGQREMAQMASTTIHEAMRGYPDGPVPLGPADVRAVEILSDIQDREEGKVP